ncbi:MAG: hypothetical protein WDW36_001632 [Sanguina aurantia]
MPPTKKGGAKQLTAAAQLTAFASTYKAAARRHGVVCSKAIQDTLELKLQDGTAVDKGPEVSGAALRAVLDCLAGYPGVKNLCCWGCCLGDEGLYGICQLLKCSVDQRWRGSSIRLLEVTSDGASVAPSKWPERYLSFVNGTSGSSFTMPSLLFQRAEAVSHDTAAAQQQQQQKADVGQDSAQAPNGDTHLITSLSYRMAQQARPHTAPSAFPAPANHPPNPMQAHGTSLNPTTATPGPNPMSGCLATHQLWPPVDQAPFPAFSHSILKELGLSLGCLGLKLQVLVLDHNHLGDDGVVLLLAGLRRCKTLKQLSMAHCGIGHCGASCLGKHLKLDPVPAVAEQQPKFLQLNLSGNPMGGEGLIGLCEGLRDCATLKVISLASISLQEQDNLACEVLSDLLASNTSIDQVDLDHNHIGAVCAAIFLPMLREAKHMRKFRVSARVGREVGAAITQALKANHPVKQTTGKK